MSRGFAFLEQGELFSKELGHQGDTRGKEQPDECQQLRILQELVRLSAVRTEFLRRTAVIPGRDRLYPPEHATGARRRAPGARAP